MSKIQLLFDTSGLPRSLAKPGQAYEMLEELAGADSIDVHIPEMVARERRSQIATEYRDGQEVIEEMLRGSVSVTEQVQRGLLAAREAFEDVEFFGIEELAKKQFDDSLSRVNGRVVPMDPSHQGEMWDLYFKGEPPFQGVKSRKDIPDAAVFLSGRDIAKSVAPKELHCVVHDKALHSAFTSIEGCVTYSSLKEFVKSEVAKTAYLAIPWSKRWDNGFAGIVAGLRSVWELLSEKVDEAVSSEIGMEYVEGFPGANGAVLGVTTYDTGNYNIRWDSAYSIGPGLLLAEFAGEVDCEVEYCVHRSDTYSLPSCVRVKIGDFEDDTVFDAYATSRVRVTGEMSFRLDEDDFNAEEWKAATVEVELHTAVAAPRED